MVPMHLELHWIRCEFSIRIFPKIPTLSEWCLRFATRNPWVAWWTPQALFYNKRRYKEIKGWFVWNFEII